MAISSGETVDPPNRQTDSQENDDAQDGEPERQVAGPAGCQFHGGFPPVAPEPSFRTLPHRQERLNAQTWPVHQFEFQHTTGGGAAELSIKGVGRDRRVCACAPLSAAPHEKRAAYDGQTVARAVRAQRKWDVTGSRRTTRRSSPTTRSRPIYGNNMPADDNRTRIPRPRLLSSDARATSSR